MKTIKKKKKKKIKIFTIIVFILLLIHVIYQFISIPIYGNRNELITADAAIILGASSSDGIPSPVFTERINHGIWLYQNGYVKKLIFTGGVGKGNTSSDALAAKNYAIQNGVAQSDIFLEEKSTITQENISYAKSILEENGFSNVIIVSDPLHMKRAMLMAEDYGLNAHSSPTPTTRYVSLSTKIPFLAREVFFYVGYEIYRIFF